MTVGLAGQVPVVGEATEFVWWKAFGGAKHEPRNNSIAGMAVNIGELAARALDGDKPADERLIALAKAGGLATGVVPVQLLKSLTYLSNLRSGGVHPRGAADVVGGLLYGQNVHPSSNPATLVQDALSGEQLGTGPH